MENIQIEGCITITITNYYYYKCIWKHKIGMDIYCFRTLVELEGVIIMLVEDVIRLSLVNDIFMTFGQLS